MKKKNVSGVPKTKKAILHFYLDLRFAISKFWSEIQVQKLFLKKNEKKNVSGFLKQ